MSQPKWISQIEKGDVLRTRSGTLRVVRYVNHHFIPRRRGRHRKYEGIPRTSVSFTITRCSWTGRCYTTMNGNDLVQMGYRPTKATWHLRTDLDKAIEGQINARLSDPIELHCCDVKGLP